MAGGGPFKCAPGQVTDDGELTMSLAWVRLTASLSEPRLPLSRKAHPASTPTRTYDQRSTESHEAPTPRHPRVALMGERDVLRSFVVPHVARL